MPVVRPLAALLSLSLVAGSAVAQSMSPPPGTLGTMPSGTAAKPAAPSAAPVDADSPRAYLMAARDALRAGRADAAREALEQAETLVLTRSVLATQRQQPSGQSLVAAIGDARTALASSRRAEALQKINEALASPDLDEAAM